MDQIELFDELLQSLGQTLENKFGKVITTDIQRITAPHCTSQAFAGNFCVLLPHSRQKESLAHTQKWSALDRVCIANA